MGFYDVAFSLNTIVCAISCLILCDAYRYMSTENGRLCSSIVKRRLELKEGSESALFINQSRLNVHPIDWVSNFECKFEVKAPKNNGILAVIQYLSLRRNKTTGECIDYVQFKKQDGLLSKKFCDLFNAEFQMDSTFSHGMTKFHGSIADNAYIDEKGVLDVRIFVSKYALTLDEEIDMRIILTSYRNCHFKLRNDEPCSPKYNEICIDSQFINDGLYNCPFYDCVDEGGCQPKPTIAKKESMGNKVLIASLSSLLITFVLFICCLWVCKVHKILCWAQNFAQTRQNPPTNTSSERQTRQIELSEQSANSPTVLATASAPQQEEDKDLPPSYDSLFPSR